jgi:CDP-diacylglycerol--serine O-phosphatidyltransferase
MYVAAFTELNSATAWIVTAIFPICGALRLARFNVIAGVPGYFIGLPIPAAGGVLCTLALFHADLSPYILLFCTLLLSFLMVSTIKYPSFKKGHIPKAVLYVTPIIIVIAVWVGITYRGSVAKMILVPLLLYALYGLKKNVDILFARMTRRHRRNRTRQSQMEDTYKSDSRM